MMPDPNLCPPHIRESIEAYVLQGRPVGGFLHAVLCNDLMESFAKADHINIHALPHIVAYIYQRVPVHLYGGYTIVDKHIAAMCSRREQEARERATKEGSEG